MSAPEIKGPLTILGLQASNVKRITVVKIKPEGPLVQVVGKNSNGKSSVLDSIWMALDWAHSVKPAEPIRKGAKEALIKLDMGEIRVTRSFRKTAKEELATELRIELANGANITSPQKFLDQLIGELSFEPLAFMKLDDKAKFNALRSFVPDVDFDEIDAINQTDFAKRTDENRRAKELTAQAAGIILPEKMDAQRIDVTKVVADLEAAEEANKTLAARRQRRTDTEKKVIDERNAAELRRAEVARLKERIATLESEIKALDESADFMMEKLATAEPLPEEVDTAALRAQITRAQTVNADLDKFERRMSLLSQAEQHEAAAKALTDAMEARSQDVRAKIAAAKMPVPGLTLADGKAYLDGIELKDTNRAAQLMLSIAVAAAKNPKIRVIRIAEGGNDLDEDSMAALRKFADENQMQIWIERIHAEGGPPAIVMEDGHAKEPQ